jgi:hypothetical protein
MALSGGCIVYNAIGPDRVDATRCPLRGGQLLNVWEASQSTHASRRHRGGAVSPSPAPAGLYDRELVFAALEISSHKCQREISALSQQQGLGFIVTNKP